MSCEINGTWFSSFASPREAYSRLGYPRTHGLGSPSKSVCGLRVWVAALTGTKGDVRSKHDPVLDRNGDTNAHIGAK
jgi:hypothetical protein